MDYTREVTDIPTADTSRVPSGQQGANHPSGYLPDAGLVDAVNVALILNKPLLLTGDPGTGKTQLAFSLAWQLAARRRLNVAAPIVERFETKSTSIARDLFYTFDAIRRFQAAREFDSTIAPPTVATGSGPRRTDAVSNAPFITYSALGRALLRALTTVPIPRPADIFDGRPSRSVVLIDEIDKAPRDFPNDILNELDEMYFRIPELDNVTIGGRDALDASYKPIVVITSNSERNLPEPFVRRCIYYHIEFPDREALNAILLSRLSRLSAVQGPLIDDAIKFFTQLRRDTAIKLRASPAELIDWLTYLLKQGAKANESLAAARSVAFEGIGALAKDKNQKAVRVELERFLGA